MNSDFTDVQAWAAGLLARLAPAERRKVHRTIATELRRAESARIAAQRDPDGTPYTPRRASKNLRGKKGRIRRKMFARLRTAKYLRIQATADEAIAGYTGIAARIARIHHKGLLDRPGPGQRDVRYPVRRLLGFSPELRSLILDTYAQHLAGKGL